MKSTLIKIMVLLGLTVSVPVLSDEKLLDSALAEKAVQQGLKDIEAHRTEKANLLVKIGGIISPSGAQHDRANAVTMTNAKVK